MPFARAKGARLYYEETGTGIPIVFVHEFAGDHRSWEPQVRFFSRSYRCVAYNARGYPPSDVPSNPGAYSQERAVDDLAAVIRHLGLARPHVVGLSMGAFAALHFAMRHPRLARSIVVSGCGYGALAEQRAKFHELIEGVARAFEEKGTAAAAAPYTRGAYRIQYLNKDPRGWAEFARQMAEHHPLGAALTLRGVQKSRPSLYDLEPKLRKIRVPVLILTGDEDEPCLEPSLLLKRAIPRAGLWVLPKTGHTINLEEPELFNQACLRFFAAVEAGRWERRDPRALPKGAL
ncbi:MAG: alpha/beta hydrolase [Proteobacteria bacterium]|nr:alpha/beta hydrolase [Pseudomonadota bacterium]